MSFGPFIQDYTFEAWRSEKRRKKGRKKRSAR
jgi:hypothetical protein